MKGQVKVFMSTADGLLSRLIRWQTRGDYSHAGFLLPDGTIIDSEWGHGVRHIMHHPESYKRFDVYTIKDLTPIQSGELHRLLLADVGKVKYDYLAVLRFVSRRKMKLNDLAFCSEYVLEKCRKIAIYLFHKRTHAWRVSPSVLPMSLGLELKENRCKEAQDV